MRKKGATKKKDLPVLFPSENSITAKAKLEMGVELFIGKPSSRYYQYLHFSLDFLNQKLDDLSKLIGLEGTKVEVIGEISLKDGSNFIIIQKNGGEPFFENQVRLFADGKKALTNHEIQFEK